MHISSNEDWLLGAGADPLLKDLQFSQLAGNGASLFTARFTQPKNAQIRLPPLLDQFSHTLASPIST
jgi:dynein heavy chain